MKAQELFNGSEELDPIERLRFFVSCMEKKNPEDWLDIEKYFDAVIEERNTLRNDKTQ